MKSADEFYYGFTPYEPDPIGSCAVCGDDVYTTECELDGELICHACEQWYESPEFFIEFLMEHPGSMAVFLKDNCCESWFREFEKNGREYFEYDLNRWIKKETPCR